jgi:hypothetical protein
MAEFWTVKNSLSMEQGLGKIIRQEQRKCLTNSSAAKGKKRLAVFKRGITQRKKCRVSPSRNCTEFGQVGKNRCSVMESQQPDNMSHSSHINDNMQPLDFSKDIYS